MPSIPRRPFIAALLLSALSTPAFAQAAPSDPMAGTVWNLLGVDRQKINEFTFLGDGKVKCAKDYKNATWRRIDGDNILFGYGVESHYVVFRVTNASKKEMRGYTSEGRVRYLQLTKK